MSASKSTIENKLIQDLKATIEVLTGIYARPDDIHTHTRTIGNHYRQFYAADIAHNLSSNTQTIDNTIAEILAKCPNAQKPNVTRVLNSIRTTGAPDNETLVNLQELLVRTWFFTKKRGIYTNAVSLIMDNLDHNIVTGGGCIPGIAARLAQPYTSFVLHMLTIAPSNTLNKANLDPDDELNLAIALSLSNDTKPQKKEQQPSEEEQAFQLALYESSVNRQSRTSTNTILNNDSDNDDELELAKALSWSMLSAHK